MRLELSPGREECARPGLPRYAYRAVRPLGGWMTSQKFQALLAEHIEVDHTRRVEGDARASTLTKLGHCLPVAASVVRTRHR
jgi:hypothetical protein